FVDGGEVAQVGQEDVELDDILQRAAGRFGHGLEVLEHLYGLRFETFHQLHALRVQRDLPGQVDGVADLDGLRIGADGGGGFVGAGYGAWHGESSFERLKRRA